MDANKLLQMIRLLTEATNSGGVEWKQRLSLMGEGYACEIAGMQVTVSQHGPSSAMGGARIVVSAPGRGEIFNAGEGEFLQATRGPGAIPVPVRLGGEVAQLFAAARGAANQSNVAIDKIISELNKKVI